MPRETADKPIANCFLKPAAKNPWYVLATIDGEQTRSDGMDAWLHAENRRIWNGWACRHLSQEKRTKVAQLTQLDEEDFAPWTTQEQAQVQQVFAVKGMSVPHPHTVVDFQETHFTAPLDMSGFVFSAGALVDSAKFSGNVSFDRTVFGGFMRFESVRVKGKASFSSATFCNEAWFSYATFSKAAGFVGANFVGNANLDFVRFCQNASFAQAIFRGSVSFDSATFHGNTWFASAKFRQDALIISATFRGFAYFQAASFKETADFTDCHFGGPINFREARFLAHFPTLSNATLNPNATFTANSDFWPKTSEVSHEAAEKSRKSLAIIRHAVGKQGLPEEEHYFYRREMAFAARIGRPLQRFPYWAFGVVSDYGNSLAKPVIGLGLVGYIGLVVYWNWLAWYAPENLDFAGPFRSAAGFSVAQLFGFLGFTGSYFRDFLDVLPWQLKVIGGIQTVAGVVLLFFLGLGLRNRFRLK